MHHWLGRRLRLLQAARAAWRLFSPCHMAQRLLNFASPSFLTALSRCVPILARTDTKSLSTSPPAQYLPGVGTFIDLRSRVVNISPVGRSASAAERVAFKGRDSTGVRRNFIARLRRRFGHLGPCRVSSWTAESVV
ncbi:hypothetical protein LY76DRAFT_590148 [Colletotrichum caudatum]|nr:hypothetical protein LY76DRAFT_590148 [Colletotrichum caudatum]